MHKEENIVESMTKSLLKSKEYEKIADNQDKEVQEIKVDFNLDNMSITERKSSF